MLDINGNVSALVKIVRLLVGNRLSTMNAQSGTIASVIQNRTQAPKPDFPYATVDHENIFPVGYSQSAQYLDDNLDEVDEFDYIGTFTIQFNGGTADDVLSICSELRERLFTTKGKRILRDNLINSGLLRTGQVVFFPTRLSTDFEEAARLSIDLWMRSQIVDETTDLIETVSVQGDLFEDL